jgi:hypothetical protein
MVNDHHENVNLLFYDFNFQDRVNTENRMAATAAVCQRPRPPGQDEESSSVEKKKTKKGKKEEEKEMQ